MSEKKVKINGEFCGTIHELVDSGKTLECFTLRNSVGNATAGADSAARTYKGDATVGDRGAARTREGDATVGKRGVAMGSTVTLGDNSIGVIVDENGDIVKICINSTNAKNLTVDIRTAGNVEEYKQEERI